jgi:hypothetical protein
MVRTMQESFRVKTTPLLSGAQADHALDQVTSVALSRREVFIPVLNAARHGFGTPGRLAPPSARGLRAWTDGVEELRLQLSRFGWQVPVDVSLDLAGFVFSPDGSRAITMVSGDGATGRTAYTPQVKYPRGKVVSEYVQDSLFDEVHTDQRIETVWYLLHRMSDAGWSAELSLPSAVDRRGLVTSWAQRIEIAADRPLDGGERTQESTPDLPMPMVRWRESA